MERTRCCNGRGIIDVNFNNYARLHVYLMIRGKNADDACIGRGEPSRASLRSVPPRVSNFFLSVSRSAMAANARADLSRCAFIRVEQAMRNWPRPMKIRIRYGSTNSRPMHLPPSVSPFPLFFCFGQDEMDLNERPGCLRNCDICQDDVSHRIDRSLSLSLSPSFVSARDRKRKWRNRGGFSRVEKPRRLVTSRPMIASFSRVDLNGHALEKGVGVAVT